MKNKKNLLSSLIIALIAGFIYFRLGGVEDIKNIASLSYRMVSEPIEEIANTQLASNAISITNKKIEKKSVIDENSVDVKRGLEDPALINQNGNIISLTHDNIEVLNIHYLENSLPTIEGDITFSSGYFIPFGKNEDVYLETIRVPDYEEYIVFAKPFMDYYEEVIPVKSFDDEPVIIMTDDSNCVKLKFDGIEMEGFNKKLNAAMQKLNLALEKLSNNLRCIDFNLHNRENQIEFELKMKEFEEDMKEFELEMKDFGTEFESDMKEFKEDMKEYKEDMKKFKKEIEENRKEIKE